MNVFLYVAVIAVTALAVGALLVGAHAVLAGRARLQGAWIIAATIAGLAPFTIGGVLEAPMMVCLWSSVLGIALFALRAQWRSAPTVPDAPPPVHPAWTVPVGIAVFCAAAVLSWAMFYGPF